jgi:hypothetical protein
MKQKNERIRNKISLHPRSFKPLHLMKMGRRNDLNSTSLYYWVYITLQPYTTTSYEILLRSISPPIHVHKKKILSLCLASFSNSYFSFTSLKSFFSISFYFLCVFLSSFFTIESFMNIKIWYDVISLIVPCRLLQVTSIINYSSECTKIIECH